MAAKSQSDDESISDINIVPLVDIILVVLIIFMVTAPAMMKPVMPVTLPEAGSGEQGEATLLQVAINADGQISFNNIEVDEASARQMATQEFERNSEVQAVIAADKDTPHGQVIRVMDWIKSSGVKRIAVTTDKTLK